MKKILFLVAALVTIGASANAQAIAMTGSGSLTAPTSGYVTAKVAGGYGHLSIQLNLAKTSGTVAGTAYIQASNDGTNYASLINTDTLTLADVATNTKVWSIGPSPFLYYRVKIVTTGTNVVAGTGYYLFRPHQ